MELDGAVALVTGAAQRVGKAVALGLARAGADVFIHYNSSAGPAGDTAAEVRRLGVRAETGQADLGDTESISRLLAAVAEALGPPNVLINGASGFADDTLLDVTREGWMRSHAVTLMAPVFLTQAFAAALPDGTPGAVVNISDVKTATPYKSHFSYIVAKGGLDTFTKAAAVALAPRVRVNAVALGVILPPPGEDDAYVEKLASRLPLQKVGGTDPVVSGVLALLENDFVTGEILRLDGGAHLV